MALRDVSLGDKYDLAAREILISGTQAVIRLALMQKALDAASGLDTAGYVTGYRGSPLGGLDIQFQRARERLRDSGIVFQPGLNEDLAATAVWGSQQAEMRGEGRHDGVFGIWYGKGPGVDRSGDALRHANLAGTSRHGGVLALMGDDHICESSTTAHQSEFAFVDAMIPILAPSSVQDILDYGLAGIALSRFAGSWVGLKCVKDVVETTASVDGWLYRIALDTPHDFDMPEGGLNIRTGDQPLVQEARLHEHKVRAALAFARANRLDRVTAWGGPRPRIGVAASGKAWSDLVQALADLGIDELRAADLGLRLYKIAMPWPLEPEGFLRFVDGLDEILIVEEKRGLIEPQAKELLYGRLRQPRIVGKKDENGQWLLPSKGALDSNMVALALAQRLARTAPDEGVRRAADAIRSLEEARSRLDDAVLRTPYFCAGCPHNSSTKLPEGARAYAGIGCHYMAQWMDRETEGYTHMGGEGANWIGEAPFSSRGHVFQNLGDGTYNHSGSLAIRAARAAGIDITYKILFNDAVAMTGGQALDGGLTVDAIARQVAAEGVSHIALVTDDSAKYPPGTLWPRGMGLHERDELEAVQRDFADLKGVGVIIYDQTCAAEKRRRRKRGRYTDPARRVVVNEAVCEGCGDCGVQSNCVAIVPVETEFGRKRQIDQSACNKDFSCLKGFCPSFVTVEGAAPRRPARERTLPDTAGLPEPETGPLDRPFGLIAAGMGGTGVVTTAALVGMAAHLDGRAVGVMDMTGLAQKGGAVSCHIRIARGGEPLGGIRIAAGGADLLLGGDLVVAASSRVLGTLHRGSRAFVNAHKAMTGAFTRDADAFLPAERMKRSLAERLAPGRLDLFDATRLAQRLLGDSVHANMILLGRAVQAGALPLSVAALERAIALNGVAVEDNLAAFRWGRLLAHDPARVAEAAGETEAASAPASLDETIARRAAFLAAYQNPAYAERYAARIARIRAAEIRARPGCESVSRAAASALFKLMAVKDEYEVARLHVETGFLERLARDFQPGGRIVFHLAPPLLARRDPVTGRPRKMAFGPWIVPFLRLLAKARRLRGSPLDLFALMRERRAERRLLAEYEVALTEIEARLAPDRLDEAARLAAYPEAIRGFGPVKQASIGPAEAERERLLAAFRAPAARVEAAE